MMCAGQRGKDIDGVVRDLGKNPETGKSIAAENKGLRPPTHYLLLTTAELIRAVGLIPHKSGLGLRRMGYMQDPSGAR